MDAGCSLEAPSRDALLGLATVCALVACATISGMRPTVLIVDDHAAFRVAARALLQAEGFNVVGEAADGAPATPSSALFETVAGWPSRSRTTAPNATPRWSSWPTRSAPWTGRLRSSRRGSGRSS